MSHDAAGGLSAHRRHLSTGNLEAYSSRPASMRWGARSSYRGSWRNRQRMSMPERVVVMNNNMGFALQPWAASVTDFDTHPTPHPARFAANLLYSAVVGVPLALVFSVAAAVLAMTVVGRPHARLCATVARYVVYPFGRVLVVPKECGRPDSTAVSAAAVPQKEQYDEDTPLKTFVATSSSDATAIPVITADDVAPQQLLSQRSFLSFVLFSCVAAPMVSVACGVFVVLCGLSGVAMPTAEMLLRLLRDVIWGDAPRVAGVKYFTQYDWAAEQRAESHRKRQQKMQYRTSGEGNGGWEGIPACRTVVEIITPGGLAYMGRSVYGVNIVLLNMLCFVPVNFVFYLVMENDWVEANSVVVLVCGLVALVPLSYLIGHSVASIAAQTSFFIGAVLNATFGSLIELLIYFLSLTKGLNELVVYATTGALLACMLLLPGLSMLFGGMRYKEQRFNKQAGQVSAILMFVAISGLLMPSIFYEVNRSQPMACSSCTAEDGKIECADCMFGGGEHNFTTDTLYKDHVRPMSYGVCGLLLLCYFVGLLFALHTHAYVYDEQVEEQPAAQPQPQPQQLLQPHVLKTAGARNPLSDDAARLSASGTAAEGASEEEHAAEGGGGHGVVWPRNTSIFVLLFSTGCFAVSSESLLAGLEPSLDKMGIEESFAGLTIIAIVPCIAEFVNAVQFAMRDNIKLSLEIGNIAAVQMMLVQVPVLFIGSMLMGKSTPDDGFALLYPLLNISTLFVATLVLTYVLIDGSCNYFRGVGLLVIYVIILLMFYYKPHNVVY